MQVMVLARPYLMTLYVIFPIHSKIPIRSTCVLKAIIHRKKNSRLFYSYLRKFFLFQKDAFYYIVHAYAILLLFPFYHDLFLFFMFLFLTFIYYFRHITYHIHGSFLRDFPFSSFPLIF